MEHEWLKDGGPAFPAQSDDNYFKGMSLRDYFAAKALPIAWSAYENGYYAVDGDVDLAVARCAYNMADAMLKAREE